MSLSIVLRLFAITFLAALSSCQSSRLPAWFTPSASYHGATPALIHPIDSVVQTVVLTSEAVDQPVLTAALPTDEESNSIASVRPRSSSVIKPFGKAFYQHVLRQYASPDTINAQRNIRPTPKQMRDGDTTNAFFHTIGIIFLVLGAVLIIAAFAGGGLVALVYGVLSLVISIPFLIFKSTKSTKYIRRQEERAARRASKGR